MKSKKSRIVSFRRFYLLYLLKRKTRTNRILHFAGVSLSLVLMTMAVVLHWKQGWLFVPGAIYIFAFVGDVFYEKKRLIRFKYPVWGLLANYVFFFEVIFDRRSFECYETKKDLQPLLLRRRYRF